MKILLKRYDLFVLALLVWLITACVPAGSSVSVTEEPLVPTVGVTMTPPPVVTGCSAGGEGVFTPDDVRCYLNTFDPEQVQIIDAQTAVLFTVPQPSADWIGAALIYHIPTLSTLVLDRFGDVDPQASIFTSRAAAAALSETAGDAELMADLKQQVQRNWQTTSANEPEIRLSTAWQDGETTIFLIAIAGLASTDDRFYCPSQTWTIGNNIEEIVADCVAQKAGVPVSHVFFEAKTIKGTSDRAVQIALDGVPSNVVQVHEGEVAQETAVYQAVLQQLTNRALIIRDETAPGANDDGVLLETAVDPGLLQNYLAANESPHNLRFLFHNSNTYFVTPSAAIARDYLPVADSQLACTQFRSDYPGLEGIVTLSNIGLSEDGMQALVHVLYECGSPEHENAYYVLTRTGEIWQAAEIAQAAVPPTSRPTAATDTPVVPTTAVYPYISLTETIPFTQATHGYTLQYPVGFHPVANGGIESDSN